MSNSDILKENNNTFDCKIFSTCKEIENKFPDKKCPTCDNFIYEDGITSCKLINQF